MSTREYKQLKLEKLRAEVKIGVDQLDSGEGIVLNSKEERHELFDDVKYRGRKRTEGRKK